MPTVMPASFESFFKVATKVNPYRYQSRLANADPFPEFLDVPTGCGKTAAVVLAWLWRRTCGHTLPPLPRRLVYCLPMRTLVDQAAETAGRWTRKLFEAKLLVEPCRVHILMGGEQADKWEMSPERNAIIIGTQDMLLSRLLNRGFGMKMSRYRWPMHFGLLGNDCLWVMDEVQLTGSGLATTVQVDAFQKKFWSPARPCHFLWMSATLGETLLSTRDREDLGLDKIDPKRSFSLAESEKREPSIQPRVIAEKAIELRKEAPALRKKDAGILDEHISGRMSLVIWNTVPTAQGCFRDIRDALSKAKRDTAEQPQIVLLHSRFRSGDRERQMKRLQEFVNNQDAETGTVKNHPGLIVVSTQVVEAGVDISSIRLWSEIAPWASVIQRLGRLNREGKQEGAKAFFWMPGTSQENTKGAPNESKKTQERNEPYLKKDLETARKLLELVRDKMKDDGPTYRQALDAVLATDESRKALEVE